MFSVSPARLPRLRSWRLLLILAIGLFDCVLILAYWPALTDSLEEAFVVQPAPPDAPPPQPSQPPDVLEDIAGVIQPPTFSADKAPLDDDTPVIGVTAGGRARAYLLEAFQHGPGSHLVNDMLGGVPISVTHCDISGCTRVFTGVASGPLELVVGGRQDSRMVLKCCGHLYRHETSDPLDNSSVAFPYREYPAALTAWGDWRQAHPESDVYMGSLDESTPPEAGGPEKKFSSHKSSLPLHHAS